MGNEESETRKTQEPLDFPDERDRFSSESIKKSFQSERTEDKANPWTSLEIAKLVVGTITALLIAGFGGYATWNSHKQDADRTTQEDLRIRKEEILPLIVEFKQRTYEEEAELEGIAGMLRNIDSNSGVQGGDDVMRDYRAAAAKRVDTATSTFNAHWSSLEARQNEFWVKVRYKINKDEVFNDMQELYNSRIVGPFLSQRHICISNVLESLKSDPIAKPPDLCNSKFDDLVYVDPCMDYITGRLEDFDRPSSAFSQLKEYCERPMHPPTISGSVPIPKY